MLAQASVPFSIMLWSVLKLLSFDVLMIKVSNSMSYSDKAAVVATNISLHGTVSDG